MPRLRLRPRGLIPGISFGREPSNSTGGTFTRVASGFPGARCSMTIFKPADLHDSQIAAGSGGLENMEISVRNVREWGKKHGFGRFGRMFSTWPTLITRGWGVRSQSAVGTDPSQKYGEWERISNCTAMR